MKQIISFDKLKLTNNQLDENGHVSPPRIFFPISFSRRTKNSKTFVFADHIEFHASLSTQIPHCLSSTENRIAQHRSKRSAQFIPSLHLFRDIVHSCDGIPEPTGKYHARAPYVCRVAHKRSNYFEQMCVAFGKMYVKQILHLVQTIMITYFRIRDKQK